MLEQISQDLDQQIAQKEVIERELQELRSKLVYVNEQIEKRKKKKENSADEERIGGTNRKKPASILDRLGPKGLKDHQKVDSWTEDRFLKVKEAQNQEQKADKKFLNNYVVNTLETINRQVSLDSVQLERVRAREKELEDRYSEDNLLQRQSQELASAVEKNEADLEDVRKKIEELKEKFKHQKQIDREAVFSNFYKTRTQPSVYFCPAKIDDWVTEKYGMKATEIREDSQSKETWKKTTREEKYRSESEEENEIKTKKRRVDDDDEDKVIIVERPTRKDEDDDDEVQIIEVRDSKSDNDLGFSIRVSEEGRTISLK